MSSPTVALTRPERRLRAMSLRRKPNSAMALSTRSTSAGATAGSLLTTRDTVLRLTPACRATSTMVGRRGVPSRTPVPAIWRPPLRGDRPTIPGGRYARCRQAERDDRKNEVPQCKVLVHLRRFRRKYETHGHCAERGGDRGRRHVRGHRTRRDPSGTAHRGPDPLLRLVQGPAPVQPEAVRPVLRHQRGLQHLDPPG